MHLMMLTCYGERQRDGYGEHNLVHIMPVAYNGLKTVAVFHSLDQAHTHQKQESKIHKILVLVKTYWYVIV